MALANFFDKAALGAAQILQGVDHATFTAKVESHLVGIAFDKAACDSPEARTTLELCVNLLSRLYPRLAIEASGEDGEGLTDELIGQARAINPVIDIQREVEGVTACLVVGDTPLSCSVPVVYLGSDGWIAHLSSRVPCKSGASCNPFGAGAAACFGVANIFRLLFGDSLPCALPDEEFSLSLLDFDPTASTPLNPVIGPMDLGETHLVGLGAIGNGAMWALSRVPGLSGNLHLIDHEAVDLSNLQRYVLTTQKSVQQPKVELAIEAFKNSSRASLQVHPHAQRWGDYLRTRGDWNIEGIAVALDTARDRMTLQAALPRWIVNAWTQAGDLGVSRHEFRGEQACLMCLYLPEGKQKDEDELIAEAIGLPQAKMEVRQLLHTGQPVGSAWIERIAGARGVPVEPLLPFADKSLREFHTGAICGGLMMKLGGSSNGEARAEVPMAFQSTLSGILLAGELVARAGKLRPQLPLVATRIDLLRPLPHSPYLSQPHSKHRSGRCICQDADYIGRYEAKYPVSA